MMNDNIKKAFDGLYADEQLKLKTKQYVKEKVYEKRYIKQRIFIKKYVYAFLICFVICGISGGGFLYFTPTTVLSIDINPSVEIDINRFDKVIGAESYNEDGTELIKTLDIMYKSYDKAFDEIMYSELIKNYLSQNEILSVAVVKTKDDQGDSILDYVKKCTDGQKNVLCYSVTSEEMSKAHSLGLSCGKYKAYLELLNENPQITPEEIKEMTMREIRNMLNDEHTQMGHKKQNGKYNHSHSGE